MRSSKRPSSKRKSVGEGVLRRSRSSTTKNVRGKKISKSKKTWELMLNDKKSVNALKKSWTAKNPQEYYRNTIKKLAKEHGLC